MSGYNGAYLEGLMLDANKAMQSIKKYKSFNLSLLDNNSIISMKDTVDNAIEIIKAIDFNRYRSARKYSNSTVKDRVDKFLAIDDFVYNDEDNLLIGIDWTTNVNNIGDKVDKHNNIKEALNLIVDKTCVVCVQNEDVLGDLSSSSLAKAVYKLMKKINKAVGHKDYVGYLIVDANDLV